MVCSYQLTIRRGAQSRAHSRRIGSTLLDLAPTTVSDSIRGAGYRRYEYTHELVAQIYSLLIERRQRKESERPSWLNQELYDLVKRVTAWRE
jgi:hypothetical protein